MYRPVDLTHTAMGLSYAHPSAVVTRLRAAAVRALCLRLHAYALGKLAFYRRQLAPPAAVTASTRLLRCFQQGITDAIALDEERWHLVEACRANQQ